MKDRKYELNRFSIYDTAAVQRHLEEMAAKGWMIRKLGMYLCQYERIEPRKLHFAVVEQNQKRRRFRRNLFAKLAAYAAARPRYHHDFVFYHSVD